MFKTLIKGALALAGLATLLTISARLTDVEKNVEATKADVEHSSTRTIDKLDNKLNEVQQQLATVMDQNQNLLAELEKFKKQQDQEVPVVADRTEEVMADNSKPNQPKRGEPTKS